MSPAATRASSTTSRAVALRSRCSARTAASSRASSTSPTRPPSSSIPRTSSRWATRSSTSSSPPVPSSTRTPGGAPQSRACSRLLHLTNGDAGGLAARRSEAGSKGCREADNQQLLQLEEKDVISSTATVLSELCGPQEWVPMNKLHEVIFEKYGNLWHHNRVRKYLASEDWPESETDGRPWHGLSVLLRKYPEHFVINIRKAGGQSTEFVSLVSLQP